METSFTGQLPQIVSHDELARRLPPSTPAWVTAGLLSLTGLDELNRAYAGLGSRTSEHRNPFEEALAQLRIRLHLDAHELSHVPPTGATIVVANHPFGGVDGLALGAAMLRRRNDVRIIANTVLSRITKLTPWFLQVQVFGAASKATANVGQIREGLRHLATGGLLIVFPAGSVSRFQARAGEVTDADWSPLVGMLARRSGATVVPCYFPGNNGLLFQTAGLIHPHLGTLLLPRELLARQDTRIRLRIGHGVAPNALRRFENDDLLTSWLRLRTYDLRAPRVHRPRAKIMQPLSPPVDPREVRLELDELAPSQLLFEQGPYRVYVARQADIPRTVEEVARLRELTFRAVSEGTGCARDLDVYDSTYQHLVLYDADKNCVVGAYRLVFCDDALKTEGLGGLYTSSLFRYGSAMRKELSYAIELGRSFVRPEYQRKPLALALLWRGVGTILCRNPRYRRLIGPVSISDRYRGSSLKLLLSFLAEVRSDEHLRRHVAPLRPLRLQLDATERRVFEHGCRDLRELSQSISDLTAAGLRVPVLLERYLDLGARVLALSLDPSFGNCVDALVVVRLDDAPERVLKRFMGDEGHEAWSRAIKSRR